MSVEELAISHYKSHGFLHGNYVLFLTFKLLFEFYVLKINTCVVLSFLKFYFIFNNINLN